jgi:hypothetical protein
MNTPVKYVAEPTHVREVSLFGTADLGFWKEQLAKENLAPAESAGRAQLLIIAADLKFMGVRFQELSFSVLVAQRDGGIPQHGAFLLRAFNTCRFFAFCERVFFSTPYYYGAVRVSAAFPASMQLAQRGETLFRAEMQADPTGSREPVRTGEDGWEAPVFLPATRRGKDRPGRLFFARIKGHTRTYPFLPSIDSITITPSRGSEVLQALLDSQFTGQEWAVREDATHAKSKTYQRSEVFAE